MIYEYFQIKSSSEPTESDSRKICYLCLPKNQQINDNTEIIKNKMCEMESVNE
jgi:hypothetical protein